MGLVPVLHGDVVLDAVRGVAILSGDTVLQALAGTPIPPIGRFWYIASGAER
jgi:isopentenyl phosphate kinase